MDVHFTTKVHKQNQFVDYQCAYYGDHDHVTGRGHHSMDTDSLQTDSICGILCGIRRSDRTTSVTGDRKSVV